MKMKLELVNDWKSCLKWYSQWSHTALASAGGVWLMIPADMRAAVSLEVLGVMAIALGVAGFVGRIIKQSEEGEAS